MVDLPDWKRHFKEKYGKDKKFSPSELQSERARLEKKYGEKIVLGKLEDMATDEEKLDKIEYEALTSVLQKAVPEMKALDDTMILAYKAEGYTKLSFAVITKAFWIVLGILLMLATIKYLLS